MNKLQSNSGISIYLYPINFISKIIKRTVLIPIEKNISINLPGISDQILSQFKNKILKSSDMIIYTVC